MMILSQNGVEGTPANFVDVEHGLLSLTGGDKVLWSGRAATSLYYAYEVAKSRRSDIDKPEVIVPAIMCATAANVAHIADIKPRFADVGADTGLISIETIKQRLTKNTIAVVVIHLLGHTINIDPIAAWCKENNILLIEDPTQALGGTYPDGRMTGSVGDVAVYSFNRTKIIDKGNGVLVTNTDEASRKLQKILTASIPLSSLDNNIHLQLAQSYRNLHHSLVGLLRLNHSQQQISESFLAVRAAYESLYLRPAWMDIDLNTAWNELPQTLAHRLKLGRLYADRLQSDKWCLLTDFERSGVCWRFTLLLDNPDMQVAFSEAVRQDGFHVSNLYWAVNQFFNPDDKCPNADSFGRRVVNLWVDNSVDETYVEQCCESLLSHATML